MKKRDLIYKAKDIITKEWKYGYYVFDSLGHQIVTHDSSCYIIDKETIGQLAFVDKYGSVIFEGDYNEDGLIVLWCENCMGWTIGCLDIQTKEIIINCHWCEGDFHIREEIDNGFTVVGNIND